MKILFLNNLYPPNTIGGYERLCFDMAGAFAARGHDVSVLTSGYGGRAEDYPGQRIHRSLQLLATDGNIYQEFNCPAAELGRINARNTAVLRDTLAAERPDAVFVWNLKFFDRSLLDAVQEGKVPVYYLLTDIWLISFLEPGFLSHYFAHHVHGLAPHPGVLRSLARVLLAEIGLRPRHRVRGHAIFASRYMKWLHIRAGLRFDGTTVIHHGVQLPYRANGGTDRLNLPAPPRLRLLCAGRIVDLKGVHTIIEALPEVIRALPGYKVRLTVLGDSRDQPYVQRLRERIREHGLSGQVTFAPAVGERELPELFRQHDIYLFPSLYEPFSLTLIHALHSGIPTIASDAGGNIEIVRHGRTGLVFPRGDAALLAQAIVALAADARLRRRLSDGGRRAARDFTFARMADRIERYIASRT